MCCAYQPTTDSYRLRTLCITMNMEQIDIQNPESVTIITKPDRITITIKQRNTVQLNLSIPLDLSTFEVLSENLK